MAEPMIIVAVSDEAGRRALEHDLTRRYAADYRIQCFATGAEAAARLVTCDQEGIDVAIIMSDLWLDDMDGLACLARARALHAGAKRILLVEYGDLRADDKMIEGAAFGLMDRVLTKQGFPAEEWLYPTIAEFLADWSRNTDRPRFEAVRVFGELWDEDSHVLRDLLTRNNIPFGFYDVQSVAAQRLLAEIAPAADRLPVVAFFRGQVLVAPERNAVAAMLGARLEPERSAYDLAIVGGGPAGLSAAVYGASEGLRTVLVEPDALGGQAGTSSMIRNYLGFPEGISGIRLAQAAAAQARLFGGEWVYDAVVALRAENGGAKRLTLASGAEITCRAVVIATGVAYRRLAIPALEDLVGSGVFYGAAISEAQAVRDQEVAVVGAGNSAGQAAIYLATRARRVTMLVRGDSLAESMSDYLVRQIEATPGIVVRTRTEVVDGGGAGRLQWLTLLDTETNTRQRHDVVALFVLIGAAPRTDWLAGAVARDKGGYILTGRDVLTGQDGGPALLETSLPGVFAAGDVRHGATKRVATAVGDGALAVRFVHEFLAETTATR